jgi:hypothetical protein
VQLSEIMTPSVVTAGLDADTLSVAQLMRDRSVGSLQLSDNAASKVVNKPLASARGQRHRRKHRVLLRSGGESR